MNKNMFGKLEIKRLTYSRMLKSEVAEYASNTINIIQRHGAETLLIEPVFNLLLAQKPKIDILRLRYGIDPLRLEVASLKAKLMLKISNLKLKVRITSKTTYDAQLHLVTSHIDSYLLNLNKSKNDKVISQKVQGFIQEVEVKAALNGAFRKHNLMDELETIELAYADFVNKTSQRVLVLSERPNVTTKAAIDELTDALDDLFKAIEVAHLVNLEVDYEPVVNELNELFRTFNLSALLRAAYNKRKANGEATPNVGELEVEDVGGGNATAPETPPAAPTALRTTSAKHFNDESNPIEPTGTIAANSAEGADEASGTQAYNDSADDAIAVPSE